MGAEVFFHESKGKTAESAFNKAVKEAAYTMVILGIPELSQKKRILNDGRSSNDG